MSRPEAPATPRLDLALSRDQGRLRRMQSRLREKPGDDALRAAFVQALMASVAERERREAQRPVPEFDNDLPISREAETIIGLIRQHQVVVIAGETGSGKTTQLPKLCLAAGRGVAGLIGCTQPRRIAARAVARRVAEELKTPLGGAVGYQVRFTENVGEQTYVKFMTDGILLAEIQSDRWLSRYDTLIIDEAHERSLNIDFLLGYLKQLVAKRRDLKLIVTSATIDTSRFAKHFNDAPVLSVEGRSYPVDVRYRPLEEVGEGDLSGRGSEETRRGDRTMNDAIVAAMDEITREDPLGDTLVFLPGEREIRDAHLALSRRKYRNTEVLALYARLSAKDQDRVFQPGPQRRIVLATNVAETSLTVPRIRYVIDPGAARVKRYSPRQKLDRLHIEPISQASADQRKGRCGRVAAGTCYRLYSEADFQSRPRYTDPEILRASLAGVILRMLDLGLGRVEDFPFIDPPDPRAISDGWQTLSELGAVAAGEGNERRLTPIGREMARLPIDPKLARMLIAARQHGVLREMLVIAAFLGIQDPRERPADAREAADQAHAAFADPTSEFLGVLKLWEAYRLAHEDLTQSKLRGWCEKHYLGFLRMREWRELHRQLRLSCEELKWEEAPASVDESETARLRGGDDTSFYTLLHRALIAGLPSQIGHRSEKGLYDAPRQRKFQIFPGSSLSKTPPAWLLVATMLDTQKVWGLMAAKIEPDWVIAELSHLLARKHFDPHWSRAQGRVLGSEQISLFGLVLAPKKPVHYGGLYPVESREIFVRQALLPGEINTRSAFVARNLSTLSKAQEEEAKQRRAGLIADEDWQARWYLDRLPPEINSVQGLDSWYGKLAPEKKKSLEWSLADLLPGEGSEADRFPKYFALGDARLALHYRFEPAAEDDGVTLDVPLHLLKALDPARLSWLVPGLVDEKAAELIRSLPKALRRNYVPAPDFARAFVQAYPASTRSAGGEADADDLKGTLSRFLTRTTGAPVTALDFDEQALAPHLRMNLRLADRGRVLAMSRNLDELRQRFGERAERAFAEQAGERLAREGLHEFPHQSIPAQIPGAAGVPAYPALVDDGDTVALRVFADPVEAREQHRRGVRRLAEFALAEKVKQSRKQLPVSPKLGLLYAAIESAERLRADIVEAALAAALGGELHGIRDKAAFDALVAKIGRELFAEAMQRLQLAEAVLALYAEIKPRLESPLMGWARGNLDDIATHLRSLVHPGFLRETPASLLAEYPRYLKALKLRGERALADPVKDQARLLELRPYAEALERARETGQGGREAWQEFRQDLEELRVQTFAQELGTRRPVSHKRLAKQLEGLSRSTG
ncbi:ATP-dependent RNA helicase HrpA [Arenimonas sp.]|uniref:ATP-dependent RNA helicase HrpA n=1 Tax=Arenimonas sp. TaxID=1872635 RepID=UPI0039E5AA08